MALQYLPGLVITTDTNDVYPVFKQWPVPAGFMWIVERVVIVGDSSDTVLRLYAGNNARPSPIDPTIIDKTTDVGGGGGSFYKSPPIKLLEQTNLTARLEGKNGDALCVTIHGLQIEQEEFDYYQGAG